MDSSIENDSSRDSNDTTDDSYCTQYEYKISEEKTNSNINVVSKLFNRQLYGRFAKNPKARNEKIYEKIPETCNRLLSEVLPEWDTGSALQHIYMGFTICGQYLLSYTWTTEEDLQSIPMFSVIYYLCVWRYAPGHRLKLISKQKIFRHYRPQELLDVTFSQWPTDRDKVVAYGVNLSHPSDAYITVLYLPTLQKCEACIGSKNEDDLNNRAPCLKHSVTIDFMLSLTTPFPVYNPVMHLAYPDHIVINTGHYLHVINVTYINPKTTTIDNRTQEKPPNFQYINTTPIYSENSSDISETTEEFPPKLNIVEAIIQDFSDLESSECSKPFHELNISCEPLNVTGKSYLLINAHSSNNSNTKVVEKPKIDKKIAEKAYEFTEENEKCEKLSSFRKKRLADKKYEFSEDNCENIVPFQLLRQERRFLLRNQNRLIRSPDYFVSPRSQTVRSPRSPMLSPGNRNSSTGSPRSNCPSLRLSPRSPISPKDSASLSRKFHCCSDCDSRLVLRQIVPKCVDNELNAGLLILDEKKIAEKPKWIKKVVKKYASLDFETASLISDAQSRDDDLGIDLPTLVHTANNYQIDPVPNRMCDLNEELIGPHLKVTQKTFDSEQFCQRRAEKLCAEDKLKFTHCEDYDIKTQHICPLSGDIICTADLKIGAVKDPQRSHQSQIYTSSCMFVWNMVTDSYRVLESLETDSETKLVAAQRTGNNSQWMQSLRITELPVVSCKKVRYMTHHMEKSLHYLRDSDNYIQISMDRNENGFLNYLEDEFSNDYHYSDLSDLED